jgi:CRISPR-associated endonuclease/helicase Cas3
VLAVPGYCRFDDQKGTRLPDFTVQWPDLDEPVLRLRGWASEHPKRYLSAPVAVGTIDQALLAGMRVAHAHLRAVGLSRSLLVIDEVHASDAYMTRLTLNLVRFMRRIGGHVLLMSATLGGAVRHDYMCTWQEEKTPTPTFESCVEAPYPALTFADSSPAPIQNHEENRREIYLQTLPLGEENYIAGVAASFARQGACVLVLRNKVASAVATCRLVEEIIADAPELCFSHGQVSTLHHSRFARIDRQLLDSEVEIRFGKGGSRRPGVLVATQTLEQSLDVDFDVLITDLCPVDVLLQRIGRLHRHRVNDSRRPPQHAIPVCHVILPQDDNPDVLLAPAVRKALNAGINGAYEDLRILELTRCLIIRAHEKATSWIIPRDNRRLVESATHPDMLRPFKDSPGLWLEHSQQVEGGTIAQKQQAQGLLVDWDTVFSPDSASALDPDERARTRLGLDDSLVRFPDGFTGPFGSQPDQIAIPGWAAAPGPDHEMTDVLSYEGVITFRFAGTQFVYNRHGLRKEDP